MKVASKLSWALGTAGLLLLIYGLSATSYEVYFFWESKYIGGCLLILWLASFINDIRVFRKGLGKKTTVEKYAALFLSGIIIFPVIFHVIGYFSSDKEKYYKLSREYIERKKEFRDGLGSIEGYSRLPSFSYEKGSQVKEGTAEVTLGMIVKGDKKYKEVTVVLKKQQKWEVDSVIDGFLAR